MRKSCLILILLFLSSTVSCLHFQHRSVQPESAQSQLQALKAQQSNFENQVNTLISNISGLDSKVKSAKNVSEKVVLLENAIISERETVFELSNTLIPPFNLSKNACQELTNEQKINLLDQVNAAKQQIAKIKQLASTIPPCPQIKLINSDIQKQSILIESVEKAIYTKCDSSIILSPTIFQSNIYASNWILGNQTIDDLIQQYYQRSIQYDNITNCPLEFPFFDGRQCIQCKGDNPIFNMKNKQCQACPLDNQLNIDLRTCEQIRHYSDFSKANNYNLDGASNLPNPDTTSTPCPQKTPFWNGTCLNCKTGKWWSVKDNVCKSCPTGKVFDINSKNCIAPTGSPYLTILEGTQWVTSPGNFTSVLKQRADFLSNNSKIQYCSDDAPYFDGIQCISCDDQFDLKTLKCTSAPKDNAYDDNVHSFLPQETKKQTNSKAKNILSSAPLTNTSIPDCDIATPYFDEIACISCPQPFILFDVAKKQCVSCEVNQIYNQSTLKCIKRASTYISTNFNKLMGTPTKSIDDYKKELLNKVNNSGDTIIDKCSDSNQYSNYSTCFSCGSNQYFNVQSKTCATCNGTMNYTTFICMPKSTYTTNLTATDLLISTNKTLNDYSKMQSQIVGPISVCPVSKPYASSDSSCISCDSPTIYFDLQLKKCVDCQKNSFYNAKALKCEEGQLVSNVSALTNYIEVQNYTIANIKKQISEIQKTKLIIQCGPTRPFYDGTKCNSCPPNTYVNLKTFNCSSPTLVTNVAALKATNRVIEQDNYTLANIAATQKNTTLPTQACDASKPAFNGKECYSCPNDKYYKLKTNECVASVSTSNIIQLKKLKNVKQTDNYTLINLEKQINSSQLPISYCNDTAPLFNGKTCVGCDEYQLYDLKSLVCIAPQLITNTTALKNLQIIELGNNTLSSIQAANTKLPLPKKPCPQEFPLYNTTKCIGCPLGSFYNLQTLACASAISVTNVDAIKKSNNFLEVDNYTLGNISQQISKSVLPTVPCKQDTPLFDGKTCLGCPKALYNLKLNTCVNCTIQNYYDNKTNKCAPKPSYYPNSSNNNWVVGDAAGIDRLINFTLARKNLNNSKPCPAGSEFFSNKTYECQTCPTGQYFNYDTFICTACGNNQTVDPNTHVCSAKMTPGLFHTNINGTNLIYDGISQAQLQQQYDSNKTKYPNIKDCPPEKPFYDGYACIVCHPSIEYFNIETQICQNCGTDGAVYSSTLHDCIKDREVTNTSPNPAKMYSSIF